MLKLTNLYYYSKAVAKLSKVYGVSKQAVKDHFDDMNVELFYQVRKAYGREYPYYLIQQSDIEECRKWLATHKDELAKVEASRNRGGYILDNHKDEPLHFNTQREVADFLGYKATGFAAGKVYRGYELKRGSVPENNTDTNTNTEEIIPNHTIVNDSTSDTEVAKPESELFVGNKYDLTESEPESDQPTVTKKNGITIITLPEIEIHEDDEQEPLDTTVDSDDNSMYTQKSFEEDLNTEVEPDETIVNDTTSTDTEVAMSDIETGIKSDFESKVDAYFNKYYDLD